ncbi:MAG: GFA family protein [Alphaproteobacteria bacterium]
MAAVRTGGCLCGAVRYESKGDPVFSLQCHCRDCQRSSGTAYIAAMRVPAAGFRITQGVPKHHAGKADSGNTITRAFCGDCGSPLFVQVSTRLDIVGLRVGTLDDPSEFHPEADIFVKSAQPWEHLNPALPKYDTYPPGRSYRPGEDR